MDTTFWNYLIFFYLLFINILAFIIYRIDARRAKKGKIGVSGGNLFLLVLIGGGVGALLGVKIWRHKTLKKSFAYGIPIIMLLQVALLIYFFYFRN